MTAGKIASGQDFNRANTQFISIPNAASLQITGTITMEAWFKSDAWQAGDYTSVVARQYGTGGQDSYQLGPAASGGASTTPYAWMTSGSVSGGTVSTGTWYHMAATVSGTASLIYINGAQTASAGGLTISTDANPVIIGGQENDGTTTPTQLWDGIIDEVRMSYVVRPQCYIQTDYNNITWPNKTESGTSGFVTIGAEEGTSEPTAVSLLS